MAQELIDTRSDPYAAFGARTAQDGVYLSFSKGEYLYGPNKEELRRGRRLVAFMPGLRAGRRRWQGGKVVEDRTELVRDGRPEERRTDLGDNDQELWETDDKGQPRDPWVMTYILEMADPDSGESYVFTTSSSGGRRAIGDLSKRYAREYRMHAGMLPIIELGRDSYMHSNPQFGKIYNPVFKIVGWTDENAPTIRDDAPPAAAIEQRRQSAENPTSTPTQDTLMTTTSRSNAPRF